MCNGIAITENQIFIANNLLQKHKVSGLRGLVVRLILKDRNCHFVKWLIRPINTKVAISYIIHAM